MRPVRVAVVRTALSLLVSVAYSCNRIHALQSATPDLTAWLKRLVLEAPEVSSSGWVHRDFLFWVVFVTAAGFFMSTAGLTHTDLMFGVVFVTAAAFSRSTTDLCSHLKEFLGEWSPSPC